MAASDLVVASTDELSAAVLADVRSLMDAAFGDPVEPFSDHDWQHALGGTHVLAFDEDGRVLSHAALVERTVLVDGTSVRTGYVEGVATQSHRNGQGHGSTVMARIGDLIARDHQLGALSTGVHGFYGRLGWEPWSGPSFVRVDDRIIRTPDEDDSIMVLRVDQALVPDLTVPIACDNRPGSPW